MSFRIPLSLRGLAAVAVAVVLAACADAPAPTGAVPPDARMGFIPPGLCSDGQYGPPLCGNYGTVAGDGALSVELLEVCKVWSGSIAPTPIQVRLQVRGGTVKDTVFTISPGDGKNAQGNPIQCREIWMNGSNTPMDYVTVTEVLPASGYSVAWTAQSRYRPGPVGTTPINGPVQSGSGPTSPELPIGGPTSIDGAIVTFTNTPLGSIGDRVWNDANGDGVQDPSESGLAGWTVTLGGAANATTTTDANGAYSFPNLPAGNYSVCVTPQAGYTPTYDLDGIATANCSSAPLATSQNRTDVDFGYRQLGSIGDRVWNDVNGDGVQDAGEAGLSGWTVTLSGAANASTTTGANGAYSFPNLAAGTYAVCVTPAATFTQTYDLDGLASAHCATATLGAGQTRADVDFGYRQLGSIGDRVWNDVNGDGVQDAGEAGVTGWTVTITNLQTAATSSQTTGANGSYSFTDLPAGSYTVCVTAQAGFSATYDLDGIATPHCANATLAGGQNRTDVDFGYRQHGSIGDRVWNDLNADGVQDAGEAGLTGWTVTITNVATSATTTQTTGANGIYSFANLPAGTYSVCVTAAAGYAATYDLDGIATPHCANATLAAGQNRTDVDFGYRLPPVVATASIGDRVWNDVNNNGVQDNGEAGLVGWTVTLTNLATNATASQATTANGAYSFTGLVAGNYKVCVTPAAGYTQTYDLDGLATAHCATAALAAAENRTDADFGYYVVPKGSIGDRVWKDLDKDGQFDSGEWGLQGYTVTIKNLTTNATSTDVTDQNGFYGFSNLDAGNYLVCVTITGYAPTYDLDGIATPNCSTQTLAAGQNRTDVDFGYNHDASLGDRVWNDVDGDKNQDNGEAGLVGWTVTLTNTVTNATTVKTTGSNGSYKFDNLYPGTYKVCVTPQAGYTQTYDLDGVATAHCTTEVLSYGEDRTDIDFGYRTQPVIGSLGDRVWKDLDKDGQFDSGEFGLQGYTVTIKNLSTNATSTDVTDQNGFYGFSNLAAGSYQVCVAITGYAPTYDLDGIATANCANATIVGGQNRTDVDFGYNHDASLGDRVWNDADGDKNQDNSEAGLVGWTVTLTNLTTNATTVKTTGTNGAYKFDNLYPGNYKVCVTPAVGYAQTYDLDGVATAHCTTEALSYGEDRTDIDFGYRLPPVQTTGSIGNYVWLDANKNGKQDAGESGMNGVTVKLTGAATQTTTTANGGTYLFSGLGAGSYTVTVTAPSGYGFTMKNASGTTTSNDHNGSPTTVVLATSSTNDLTIDFGLVKLNKDQGCDAGFWKDSKYSSSWKAYKKYDSFDKTFSVKYKSGRKSNLSLSDALDLHDDDDRWDKRNDKGWSYDDDDYGWWGWNKSNDKSTTYDADDLAFEGTAALLNAAHDGDLDYPYSASEVQKMVRDALKDGRGSVINSTAKKLNAANKGFCPLCS